MEFRLITNPFLNEIFVFELERDNAIREMEEWEKKLAWFEGFNLEEAFSELRLAEQAKLKAQDSMHKEQHELIGLAAKVRELMPKTAMSFDPRYWFSSERSIAKHSLKNAQKSLADQEAKAAAAETEFTIRANAARDIQDDFIVARSFDPLLAKAAIASLKAMIDGIGSRLDALRPRSEALDQVLEAPLEVWHRKRDEQNKLSLRLIRAKELEARLEREHTNRRQIHDQCREELNEPSGKPRNVRIECEQKLYRLDRDIQKLEARIEYLIQLATRDIRRIIIDGNNLCYEGDRFIGLAALEVLVPLLVERYEVTLIFDPGIRNMTFMNNQNVAAKFPQVQQVHIVAHKRKADETILSLAGDDLTTYVLSNDRFIDYPEHSVVKNERLIRHEIVDHKVFLHDFKIEAKFKTEN